MEKLKEVLRRHRYRKLLISLTDLRTLGLFFHFLPFLPGCFAQKVMVILFLHRPPLQFGELALDFWRLVCK